MGGICRKRRFLTCPVDKGREDDEGRMDDSQRRELRSPQVPQVRQGSAASLRFSLIAGRHVNLSL